MHKFTRPGIAALFACSSLLAVAADMSGIIKAQVILGQATQIMDKYEDVQALLANNEIVLEVAEPREKAAGALASKVPFCGLASGMLKGKSKELAAVTAIGGWDFIRSTSDLSFDEQADFSLYLHTQFEGSADYETALAAAMAIYPDLEKGHSRAIDAAYKQARKAAKQ